MGFAALRSDWIDGNLVFKRRSDGAAILTLSTEGVIVHSLVDTADEDEDINLSLIPIANVAAPGIWNDEGTLKAGTAT